MVDPEVARAKDQPVHISYLLRLWRETGGWDPTGGGERAVWRASLESPRTGERWGFAGLTDLFAFLERECGAIERDESEPPEGGGTGLTAP
jgi:hypothetical protein